MTIKLTQEEADQLGNLADFTMEAWLALRDGYAIRSANWKKANTHVEFWTKLAMKLGCKYEETTDQ